MYSIYDIISKKRDGEILADDEIRYIIGSYVKGEIPDYQISSLLMAIYIRGMNLNELSTLTEVMMNSGDIIRLSDIKGINIDKHSTGGVGDKTSLILAPIAACCGINVPMISGRGLGHTGGTLDKLESIPGFNAYPDINGMKRILKETGMVICGQTSNLVPADKKLYALRDATATVSSIPLIASSIMSKKLALETDGIVMDIKTGNGAFMKNMDDAVELAQSMISIGEKRGRKTAALITNMNKPIGKTVGNSLEIIETIESLKGNGDEDLMELTYALGSLMLMIAGKETDLHMGIERLRSEVKSSHALEKFRQFIKAGGGNENVCWNYDLLPCSKFQEEVVSEQDGYIKEIDTYTIGMASIDIGAGRRKKEDDIDRSCGFVFKKSAGDYVKKDESMVIIHANDKNKISFIKEKILASFKFSPVKPAKENMIYNFLDKNGLKKWKN